MAKILGIDLGTTNSCMAVMDAGGSDVVENAEGGRVTPSVAAISKNGERLVGQTAKRQSVTNPENTVFSIKRLMGRKLSDTEVQRDMKILPYKIIEGSNGDAQVMLGSRKYSSPEVSAMILQKMKQDAEAKLGEKITQAVITVPAYFNDSQRQATKDAGKIAGLEVLRIINEPTAATLAYGLGKKTDETVAVYDLGGGTFDISILQLGDGLFEVKSTNGDTHLGGDDFDQRIIEWLADEFKKDQGIDLRQDKMALQRLKEAGEKAKIELSSVIQTEINIPFVTADANGPKHMNITMTRSKLEQLVGDLVDKTIEPVKKALSDAGLSASQIDEVILVGGQTRMPSVIKKVTEFFGKEPNRSVNPDEVVAIGAAIQAGVLRGDVTDVLLLDVTPLTLGIETLGGVMTPLISRNTTIPVTKKEVFSTASDSQTSVDIHVLQGERPMAGENKTIGRFMLDGLLPAPRGVPQIEVSFDIDANGILNVSALDKGTGKEQKITITASSGMSKDEIDRMIRESDLNADEDRRRREEIEVRNAADSTAYMADKTMRDMGDRVPSDLRSEVEGKIAQLRSMQQSGDTNQIRSAKEELDASLQRLGQVVYGQTGSGGGSYGPTGYADDRGGQDDGSGVVDGDFVEV